MFLTESQLEIKRNSIFLNEGYTFDVSMFDKIESNDPKIIDLKNKCLELSDIAKLSDKLIQGMITRIFSLCIGILVILSSIIIGGIIVGSIMAGAIIISTIIALSILGLIAYVLYKVAFYVVVGKTSNDFDTIIKLLVKIKNRNKDKKKLVDKIDKIIAKLEKRR